MTLKEKITDDMKTAFKAGDQATRGTLSLLLAVIQNRELEKRAKLMKAGATAEADVAEKSKLTDDEVLDAVGSEMKKRKEAVSTYAQAGRAESAQTEQAELDILMRYMPEQLSEDDVKQFIQEAITTTGATSVKDIGKVMGQVAPKTKGRFDGARVSELVKAALGAA